MPLMPWTALPDIFRALLAAGATPADLAAETKMARRLYKWPTNSNEWGDLMAALSNATRSWELLFRLMAAFVKADSPLTWPMVFTALQPLLRDEEARFEFIGKFLSDYGHGKMRPLVGVAMANLHLAGIHPASLALCSYPILSTRCIQGLLQRMGMAIDPCHPRGCYRTPWSDWHWDFGKGQILDGLVTSIRIWVGRGLATPGPDDGQRRLGNRIVVGGDLYVEELPNLNTLGNNIHVYGDLNLYDLPNLTHMGDQIRVEGNLVIMHCNRLAQFPRDLFVGGKVVICPIEENSLLLAQVPPNNRSTREAPQRVPIHNRPLALRALQQP